MYNYFSNVLNLVYMIVCLFEIYNQAVMVDNTAKQPAILLILKLVNTNMVIKTFDRHKMRQGQTSWNLKSLLSQYLDNGVAIDVNNKKNNTLYMFSSPKGQRVLE